jgi:hypothetical protein
LHSILFARVKAKLSEERPCHYLRTTHRPSSSITLMPIQFDITKITERGVLPPIPPIPQPVTAAIPVAASEVNGVETAAATEASRVASDVQSAVSAAVTSVESAIGSAMPKNCSLGTDYFCLGLPEHINCKELPLNVSSILPSSLLAIEPFNKLGELDRALLKITPRNLKACLIISAVFAGIAIVALAATTFFPRVGFIFLPLVHKLGLSWILETCTLFRFICSGICSAPLIAIAAILYSIRSRAELPEGISFETGEASRWVLAALICAIFMVISIVVELGLYIV